MKGAGQVTVDAAEAIRLVQAEPKAARALALSVRTRARNTGDLEAASMAERALGLVDKEGNNLDGAARHLRTAVRLAGSHPLREAEARMSLALVLAHLGKGAPALRQADLAAGVLRGADAARLSMQRALILQHLARFDEALDGYRRALNVFRRSKDKLWETRVLCNRGVLLTNQGQFRAAEADLLRALDLCAELNFEFGAGLVQHNLGYLAGRKGDVVVALEWYDRAAERYEAAGVARSELLLDRGELLLSVRLVAEARRAAEQVVDELARDRMALRLPEARLMLSHAALFEGDLATARTVAEQARRAFNGQGRPGWAALAAYASLRAAWAGGDRSAKALGTARRAATALEETGWAIAALDARVLAARIALDLGRVEVARRELASASRARHRGPVELRSRAWHAQALLCLNRGQQARAVTALRSGMDALEEHRAALGATELRAHLSGHGVELAALGLGLALADEDAERVFEWTERWRAGAMRLRRVRPPADPVLAAMTADLRRAVQEREQAALTGRKDAPALLKRQGELEDAVRERALRSPGAAGGGGRAPRCTTTELAEVLGDRALIEIGESDGGLHAVVVTSEGATLRSLSGAAEVGDELEAMHFALRRLARNRGSTESLGATLASVGHAATRLDSLLLEPLTNDLADRPLVIVPTGRLHATPWSLLPTCLGRPVVVSPGAALWHAAARAPVESGRGSAVVLVAGPDLPYAAAEVATLGRRYKGAVRLTGTRATVKDVLHALDGADLAHVAAHGRFRTDNPLFSCLVMADGPLTVYDLESLRRPPRVLLLSACQSGVSSVQPGDELMGLAAALLSLGTRTLIASVIDVPDEQTTELMLGVHRRLKRGASPAVALCEAQGETIGYGDTRAIAASAGFICFGSG